MKGVPAIYLGRIVEKEHFRTFIYDAKGERRLVESWDEYEEAMQTGVWFAENPIASAPVIVETKSVKKRTKTQRREELDEVVFEVKDGN